MMDIYIPLFTYCFFLQSRKGMLLLPNITNASPLALVRTYKVFFRL